MSTYDYNTYTPPRPVNPQAPKFQRGQPSYADYNTMAPQPSYPSFGQQQAPSYQSFNDPTLAAGATGGYGGPSAGVPSGAIPISPYSGGGNGNANQMASKGFKKKLINGGWYWVPPDEQSQTPQYSLY